MKKLMLASAFALSSLAPVFAGEATSVQVNAIVISDIMDNMMAESPELVPFMVPGDKVAEQTICFPDDSASEVFELQCWLKGSSATLEMRGTVKYVETGMPDDSVRNGACREINVILHENRTLIWRGKCPVAGEIVSIAGIFNPK